MLEGLRVYALSDKVIADLRMLDHPNQQTQEEVFRMNNRRMKMAARSIVVTLAGLVMVLGFVSTAAADQPEKVVIRDIMITQVDSTSCEFPFLEEFTGRVTITTFFDNEGNPIRVQLHLPFDGTLTNEASGTSVSATQDLIVVEDLVAGTTTFLGVRFRVNFPGLGYVLLDAGRVVFDADGNVIFKAGPHQVINEDFEAFCEALS